MSSSDTKVCRRCERVLSLDNFYYNKGGSGWNNYCKQCMKERAKERAEDKRIYNESGLKKCTHCKQYKELSEYYTRGKPGLYRGDCKECVKSRDLKRYNSRPKVEELECKTCRLIKSASEFNKDLRNSTGLQRDCKACQSVKLKEIRINRKSKGVYDTPIEKRCTKCEQLKPIVLFHRNYNAIDGYSSNCKECEGTKEHNRIKKIQEQNLASGRVVSVAEKQCGRCKMILPAAQFNRNVYSKTGLGSTCKPCLKIERKNPEVVERRRNYTKNRRKNDPIFRIKENLRKQCKKVLLKGSKSAKTMDLLGCDGEFWMSYLEKLFWPGMTRDNYGKEWTVDHIIPLDSFDLLTEEGQRKGFHYTNTQPLWWDDNSFKTYRLDWSPAESKHELPERLKTQYSPNNTIDTPNKQPIVPSADLVANITSSNAA